MLYLLQKLRYYTEYFEKGQQKINFNLYQIGLGADDEVYTLKKVMEEMDYTKLTQMYSKKGRKAYNPMERKNMDIVL